MAKSILRSSLCVALLVIATAHRADAVARFDTAEVVLAAATSYNGSTGTPNPFSDVDLTARVVSPSGRVYTAFGFYDGDGAGGQNGNVFKIRIYLDEVGTWRWTSTSNVASLHAKSGTVSCSGVLTGAFGKGPVVENPARSRSFMYQYGEPVYLIGKFLDVAAPSPIKYSHTMFSEKLTDTNRQAMLSRHTGMGLNKINVYLANKGDYSSVSTTPWLGTASSNDKKRFDLRRWKMFETWVLKMRASGVTAQLWFFADDSSFGNLSDADRQLLVEYGMARLSGYVNTMFTLVLEWQEGWTTSEVGHHMNILQWNNSWARMATVHGTTGNFSFPNAAWADFMATQSGNSADHGKVHSHGLAHRSLSSKPLIQEEFGLGNEDTIHRQRAWAAFTSGSAGSGTGAFLKHLATFTRLVDFELMDPSQALVLSGSAYALAQKGVAYVFYLPNGGTAKVDLRGSTGTFTAQWYDPRTGAFKAAPAAAGGTTPSYTVPASGDWVLLLRK